MTRRSCANCYFGDQWLAYRYCPACWRAIRLGMAWGIASVVFGWALAAVAL